jgi:hypothetical protein
MVKQPEKYHWNAIGYHLQTNNRDTFLSTVSIKSVQCKKPKGAHPPLLQIHLSSRPPWFN